MAAKPLTISTTISLDFLVCSLYFAIHLVLGFMHSRNSCIKYFLEKSKRTFLKSGGKYLLQAIRLISKLKKFGKRRNAFEFCILTISVTWYRDRVNFS